jgi:hypothetical protein
LFAGLFNFATLLFCIIGMVVINYYLEKMEVAFDEDEQTATDYSILITNPPGDATDPAEWKEFFQANFDAHTTAITIAVDNDLLVRCLVERREILRQIEMKVEPGTSMDTLTLARLAGKEERDREFFGFLLAYVVAGLPELAAKVVVLTAKIQGLAQQDYPATNIFVTFESEAGQRRVLSGLSVGEYAVLRNNANALKDEKYMFRGRVLQVAEPDEPSSIRWQDMNETLYVQFQQQFNTLVATVGAVALIAFIISVINEANVAWSAIAISAFNGIFPLFAKFLNSFESHASEGGKQRSLFFKIGLFRWVNTAVVFTIITPFTETIQAEEGLIAKVYALFFSEIVISSALQLFDIPGHLQRHFLAPRATTQDAMNLAFSGTEMELAERYTNMTKMLFLAFWYCAIYPQGMFMCSFALMGK